MAKTKRIDPTTWTAAGWTRDGMGDGGDLTGCVLLFEHREGGRHRVQWGIWGPAPDRIHLDGGYPETEHDGVDAARDAGFALVEAAVGRL